MLKYTLENKNLTSQLLWTCVSRACRCFYLSAVNASPILRRYANQEKAPMKWIIRIIGVIVLIPLIALIFWYFSSFYPHLAELNKIIKNEENAVSNISDIQKLAVMVESKQGIRSYALQQAYRELVFDKKPKSNADWHTNTALWYFSSYLHFNENETFYLWSALVYSGKKGLQKSSIHLYGKELLDLNIRQKAELIAMVKAPNRFKLGSSALKKRVDSILNKL